MVKRNNQVTLDGLIEAVRAEIAIVRGERIPAAHFTVRTDQPELGGLHPAVAYGRLAAEIVVFSETAQEAKAPLEATVRGWLRTMWQDGQPHVVLVADRVTFHLPSEVRARASAQLSAYMRELSSA